MSDKDAYLKSVFINCPFDDAYKQLFYAIVFTVYDCGFVPRCALEESNSADVRVNKILRIIGQCKLGIHDISRTDLDSESKLPRFNMPLELGLFLGAKHFGDENNGTKTCLILDEEKYRYQKFISDIAGQDISHHGNDVQNVITKVRNWLRQFADSPLAGGKKIHERFTKFSADFPEYCDAVNLEPDEAQFGDYVHILQRWWKDKSAL